MEHHQHLPWQLRIAAKVILSHVPISHRLLNKAGIFTTNEMENPGYAVEVFRRHFENAELLASVNPLSHWNLALVSPSLRW